MHDWYLIYPSPGSWRASLIWWDESVGCLGTEFGTKSQAVLIIKAKSSHLDHIGYYTRKSTGHTSGSCQSLGGTGQPVTASSMSSCSNTTDWEQISLDYTGACWWRISLPSCQPHGTSLKVTGSRAGSGCSVMPPPLNAAAAAVAVVACSLSVWVVSTEGGCLIYFGSMSLRNVPI